MTSKQGTANRKWVSLDYNKVFGNPSLGILSHQYFKEMVKCISIRTQEVVRYCLYAGYDNEFLPPEHNHECPICMMCLRDPYQTDCGHRFCKNCIKRWLRVEGSKRKCPACNEMLTTEKIYPDNFAKREIHALEAKCIYQKLGCEELGSLKLVLSHQRECIYRPATCQTCLHSVMYKDLEEHIKTLCPKQTVECKACLHRVQRCNLDTHKRICLTATNLCPDCGELIQPKSPDEEITHACNTGLIKCRFNNFGCNYECMATNMRMHNEQHQQDHLLRLASAVEGLMRDAQQPLQSEARSLVSEVQRLMSTESVTSAHNSAADINSVDDEIKKPALQRTRSLASPGEKYTAIPGDAVENSQEIIRQLRNQVANQQQHIIELRSKVSYLENHLQDTRTELHDTKMDLRNRSCGGVFIWRLRNYQKLRMEAKRGAPHCVIHSPGFYTNFNGYQFCIRLNLNGVENARGTHLSLFIHLMQSDNDDILSWPFTGKVTLTICDQHDIASKRNPISETLIAKPGLAAFQRPTTYRNHKGFGYMEFAPISYLENDERCFIKDDVLLIKAEVRSTASS